MQLNSTHQWLWAEYENMTVESENNGLHVAGYRGNAGDAFNDDHDVNWQSNGMQFSTLDVDNDQRPTGNCGAWAGWWYNHCSSSKLTGRNSFWYSATTTKLSPIRVSASRMMLQCGAI